MKAMISIKVIFCAVLLLVIVSAMAQSPQLTKLWETDSTLKVPESVLFHAPEKMLYVSNIDGKPDEKDLNGSISKVSLDGKIVQLQWAVNLSAPKGMGVYNNTLFVADLTDVAVIDMKTGKITRRIPVPGAVFLNDITIDKKGVVYVSDSRTGKVHRIKGTTVTTFMENKMGVNGLLAVNDDLYMAVKDTLFHCDKNKKLMAITTGIDQSSDGIVQNGNDLIVSCWNGIIYYVKPDGAKSVLIDTRAQGSNTADIGFDPTTKTVYVPTFFKNKVVAYQLK